MVQHAELIFKWIDRLKITDKIKNSYEFKLLFRGSCDGATGKRFHEICDGQSNTVTIVKVQNSNEILGGYNPIEWKSLKSRWIIENYCATKDSFIFSFKNNDKVENYVLSRVVDEDYAVYNGYNCGPSGPSFGKSDLDIWGSPGIMCHCRKCSYEKPIRETEDKFLIEEFKVFQIVKN